MKLAKGNLNGWAENDSRWADTYWRSYKTYHKMQEKFFAEFVAINAWSWGKAMGYTEGQMGAAMYEAWRVAPFRFSIHGCGLMLKGETKRFLTARDKALQKMGKLNEKSLKYYFKNK